MEGLEGFFVGQPKHQAAEAAAISDGSKQVTLGVLFQCGQIRTSSKDGVAFFSNDSGSHMNGEGSHRLAHFYWTS